MPAVTERDDAAKRGRRDAADPDRRMRLLQRLGLRAGAGDAVELALDARLTLGPHGLEHAQGLVGGAAAPREVDAEDLQLLAPPADADADDEPAARQHIDGREHLRHRHGMPVAEDEYRAADARLRRHHRQRAEHGHRLEVGHLRRDRKAAPAARIVGIRRRRNHDVIADPERGEVARLGLAREREQRVATHAGRDGGGNVNADLHTRPPRCADGSRRRPAGQSAPAPRRRYVFRLSSRARVRSRSAETICGGAVCGEPA